MPDARRSLLDRDDLQLLLQRMAEAAESRGVRIEMFIVGGGAIALVYDATRLTGDLDAVFEPKQVGYDIARQVAADAELDLPEDWLNDAVKGFLPGDDPHATVFFDRPGMSVRVASPRYLFVLKAMSTREADEDDLRLLLPLCGFTRWPRLSTRSRRHIRDWRSSRTLSTS